MGVTEGRLEANLPTKKTHETLRKEILRIIFLQITRLAVVLAAWYKMMMR